MVKDFIWLDSSYISHKRKLKSARVYAYLRNICFAISKKILELFCQQDGCSGHSTNLAYTFLDYQFAE